jgi:uncharacterized protein YeaO (DUF488 family)
MEMRLTRQLKLLDQKHCTLTPVFSARDQRHNQAEALHAFLRRGE